MKKIFSLFLLLAAVCMGIGAKAQTSVVVTNHSSCTVYYQLRGDNVPCSGGKKRVGAVAISPGASVTYTDPTTVPIPGLGTSDYITGVRVYNRSTTACTSITLSFIDVGLACISTPTSGSLMMIDPTTCMPCGPVMAVWTAASPGVPQALDFY